jgi:hypothetical protein
VKLDPCLVLQKDGDVQVPGCRGPFLVFGPYWSLPPASEVEISFDVHADSDVTLFAEVVSDTGRRKHGSLLSDVVSAGEQQRFDFRVRLEQATDSLETRIVLDGEPARFELRQLRVRAWLPQRPVTGPPEPSARSR